MVQRWIKLIIITGLINFFHFSSCKGEKSITLPINYGKTARDNYKRALYYMKQKDYDRASKLFEYIIKKFPTSPHYVALSELGLADCEFEKGNYLEAAIKYRLFIERHPSHSKVEYALFKRGEAFFKQIPEDWFILPPSIERDLTPVKDALTQLKHFTENFPNSKYLPRAAKMIEKCIEKLTAHELYVASFYLKKKNYRGVLLRCQRVYEKFPESIASAKALLLSGKVLTQLAIDPERNKQKEELIQMWNITDKKLVNLDPEQFFLKLAIDFFKKIIDRFPNTGIAQQAKGYITQLNQLKKGE